MREHNPQLDLPLFFGEEDLDGFLDESTGIEYIGKAVKRSNGKYHVLAKVPHSTGTALCVLEIELRRVKPSGDDRRLESGRHLHGCGDQDLRSPPASDSRTGDS
jgi:hypothetical protein